MDRQIDRQMKQIKIKIVEKIKKLMDRWIAMKDSQKDRKIDK